jgi:tetratricopeptide (TPR) repeat protein
MSEPQVSNGELAARWIQHGMRQRDQKQWTEALESFEKALTFDSRNPQAWALKGRALDEMNNLSEAIRCYKTSLELNPNSVRANLGRGGRCVACGDLFFVHAPLTPLTPTSASRKLTSLPPLPLLAPLFSFFSLSSRLLPGTTRVTPSANNKNTLWLLNAIARLSDFNPTMPRPGTTWDTF